MDECCGWNNFECCPAGYCSAGSCYSSRSRSAPIPDSGSDADYVQQCESCKCGGASADDHIAGVDSLDACYQAAVDARVDAFSYQTSPDITCSIAYPKDTCKRDMEKTTDSGEEWAVYYLDLPEDDNQVNRMLNDCGVTGCGPAEECCPGQFGECCAVGMCGPTGCGATRGVTRSGGNYDCLCGPMYECCGWNNFECCPAGYCSAGGCHSDRRSLPQPEDSTTVSPTQVSGDCRYEQQCEFCKCGGAHSDDHIEGVDSLDACYQAAVDAGVDAFSYRSSPDISCSIAFPKEECQQQWVSTKENNKDWAIYYLQCPAKEDEGTADDNNQVTRNTGNYDCLCGAMYECCGWNNFECCAAGYCSAGSCYSSSRSAIPAPEDDTTKAPTEVSGACNYVQQCESCKCGGAHSDHHVEGVDSLEACHQAAIDAGVDAFSYRTTPDISCSIAFPQEECKHHMVRTTGDDKDWAVYYLDCPTSDPEVNTRSGGNYDCLCGPMDECCGWNNFECCPAGYCSAGSCYSSRSAIPGSEQSTDDTTTEQPEELDEHCEYVQQCESCKCAGTLKDDHIEGVDSLEACYEAAVENGVDAFSYRSTPDIKCSIAYPQEQCKRHMLRTTNTEKDWAIYYIDCKADVASSRMINDCGATGCSAAEECCAGQFGECCAVGMCGATGCLAETSSYTKSVTKPGILLLIILSSVFGVLVLGYFMYNQCLTAKVNTAEQGDSNLLGDASYTQL